MVKTYSPFADLLAHRCVCGCDVARHGITIVDLMYRVVQCFTRGCSCKRFEFKEKA